jgi:hypothetical protein
LLLCEILITEAGTNRKTLVGIFDQLIVQRFPAHQRMAIYARLTDGQGLYRFKLDFVDVGHDRLLGEFESEPIEIPDRLRPFEVALPFLIDIEAPGLYEFRLYANDAYIGSIAFNAIAAIPSEDK